MEALDVRLLGVRFPVDVSGGVARFRNRRGELERLVVHVEAARLARYWAPRLAGLLSPREPHVALAAGGDEAVATVTIATRPLPDEPPEARALAFDLTVAPRGDDVVVVAARARGVRLPAPPLRLALDALAALGVGRLEGAELVVERPAQALARRLLPEAGARAPGTDAVRVAALRIDDEGALFVVDGAGSASPSAAAVRAHETARLAREADALLARGDVDRARAQVVRALERAAGHEELLVRLAQLDAFVGGRDDAARISFVDARAKGASRLGDGLGEVLAATGDPDAAVAALVAAAEADPSGDVAAGALLRAATLTSDDGLALAWLDDAVARAPTSSPARWARVLRNLAAGRLEAAVADVEHLEALCPEPTAKVRVLVRAGDALARFGGAERAAALFERALRFAPDDPAVQAGLGAALVAVGRPARGAGLMARAAERLDAAGADAAPRRIDLARALAEALGDLPAAVARLREVPDTAPSAALARGLEGRYRRALGDLVGASLAFARLRDLGGAPEDVLPLLREAARHEEARDELAQAHRHLEAALALAPSDPDLRAEMARVGRLRAGVALPASPAVHVAFTEAPHRLATTAAAPLLAPIPEPPPTPARGVASAAADEPAVTLRPGAVAPASLDLADAPSSGPDERDDELAVQDLTRRLELDPTNDAVVDDLAARLLRLGRTHELFALLAGRFEDASAERKVALFPRQVELLRQLEADAASRGAPDEASLFRMAREALEASPPR